MMWLVSHVGTLLSASKHSPSGKKTNQPNPKKSNKQTKKKVRILRGVFERFFFNYFYKYFLCIYEEYVSAAAKEDWSYFIADYKNAKLQMKV